MEFFTGEMAYLRQGHSAFPMRLGHEWTGRVAAVGSGVDPAWVVGDGSWATPCSAAAPAAAAYAATSTCARYGRNSAYEGSGRCPRGATRGAGLLVAHMRDSVDAVLGELVEPGGNAMRAARATAPQPGDRTLILGPGTIGCWSRCSSAPPVRKCICWAAPKARSPSPASWASRTYGRRNPFRTCRSTLSSTRRTPPIYPTWQWTWSSRPRRVRGTGRGTQQHRHPHAGTQDVTAVCILSASPGLDDTIRAYAGGSVDPRPLVAATAGLEQAVPVLAGERPADAGPGPRFMSTRGWAEEARTGPPGAGTPSPHPG